MTKDEQAEREACASECARLRLALVEIEKHNWSLGDNGSIYVTVKAVAALLNKSSLSPEEIYGYHHPVTSDS